MKNYGKNIWINHDGQRIKSTEHPTGGWFPAYNPKRVSGYIYTPYLGASDWINAANHSMKEEAKYNFQKSQH